MKSETGNQKSAMPRRVSRWFATGFRCAELGRAEEQLPLSQCENDWQKAEMCSGYAAGNLKLENGNLKLENGNLKSHVQFWLVDGDAEGSHSAIAEEIGE